MNEGVRFELETMHLFLQGQFKEKIFTRFRLHLLHNTRTLRLPVKHHPASTELIQHFELCRSIDYFESLVPASSNSIGYFVLVTWVN